MTPHQDVGLGNDPYHPYQKPLLYLYKSMSNTHTDVECRMPHILKNLRPQICTSLYLLNLGDFLNRLQSSFELWLLYDLISTKVIIKHFSLLLNHRFNAESTREGLNTKLVTKGLGVNVNYI